MIRWLVQPLTATSFMTMIMPNAIKAPPESQLSFDNSRWGNRRRHGHVEMYQRNIPSRGTEHHADSRAGPADDPRGQRGAEISVEFTVLGMPFIGINGGPHFRFSEAISFQVYTDGQPETDRYWAAIVDNGGTESRCGWCKDRFGVSWQILPRALLAAMSDPDAEAARRAMDAMMGRARIDIAGIERARAGEPLA